MRKITFGFKTRIKITFLNGSLFIHNFSSKTEKQEIEQNFNIVDFPNGSKIEPVRLISGDPW